jgi:hypothetical protein
MRSARSALRQEVVACEKQQGAAHEQLRRFSFDRSRYLGPVHTR